MEEFFTYAGKVYQQCHYCYIGMTIHRFLPYISRVLAHWEYGLSVEDAADDIHQRIMDEIVE